MLNNRPQLDQKLGGQCSDIMQRQTPYINVIHVLERCSIVFYMVNMSQVPKEIALGEEPLRGSAVN